MSKRSFSQLSTEQRLRIKKMLDHCASVQDIAEALGVSRSTIYNEIRRGTPQNKTSYDPSYAETNAKKKREEKGRAAILSLHPELTQYIAELIINKQKSPKQICQLLRNNNPFGVTVSVNTIYHAIDDDLIPGVTRETLRVCTTKMSKGGNICIPKWIRQEQGYSAGDTFQIELCGDHMIVKKKNTQ